MSNSNTRERILGKIRASLDVAPSDANRSKLVDDRISARTRHLTPARALLPSGELRAQFASYLTKGHASVIDVATVDALPSAVADYLRARKQPLRVRMGLDPRLAALNWNVDPSFERLTGRAQPNDVVSLSYAVAAAAETGTLLLASGPDNPVTLNYLPETHMVVVDAASLVGPYEAAFDIVRAQFGVGVMPRTLNLISGPSRTSDIGGKTVMGAHGPRFLAVFILG
jgi:L-lactate dehydrogenase complex protein LldG